MIHEFGVEREWFWFKRVNSIMSVGEAEWHCVPDNSCVRQVLRRWQPLMIAKDVDLAGENLTESENKKHRDVRSDEPPFMTRKPLRMAKKTGLKLKIQTLVARHRVCNRCLSTLRRQV